MKLNDFIDAMAKQESRYSGKGYSVEVELKDDQGTRTSDFSILAEVIFPAKRVTIILQAKE